MNYKSPAKLELVENPYHSLPFAKCDDVMEESSSTEDFIRTYELEGDRGSLFFIQKQVGGVHCVVWDAALVLAKYLEKLCLTNDNFLSGKRVIELGSGLGCVGMVAAFYGAEVTLTDLPEALNLLEINLRKNAALITKGKGSAKVETLDWNNQIKREAYDFILAADCIYYKEDDKKATGRLKKIFYTPKTIDSVFAKLKKHEELADDLYNKIY